MSKLYEEAWGRLPERFRKPTNKDLYYVLYTQSYDEFYETLDSIEASRNIDKAKGKSLDHLGSNVGQFRIDEDDELYRLLIKTRIIANLSIGDIPTINEVMSVLVKEVYLGLEEVWPLDDDLNEPAAIKLHLGPLAKSIPYEIIDRIKAAGVRVLIELNYRKDFYGAAASVVGEMITIAPPKPKDLERPVVDHLAASLYTEHEAITIERGV